MMSNLMMNRDYTLNGVSKCQEWGKGLEAYSPPRKDRTRTKKI
jgi:hypothetical protein